MVKRISHIIISLLLVLTTTGVTLTKHYCGNQLMSSSVFGKVHNCCGSHCNSCHNETSNYKVSDNFVSSSFKLDQPHQLTFDWFIAPSIDLYSTALGTNLLVNHFQINSSPPIADNPSALLQVFRC